MFAVNHAVNIISKYKCGMTTAEIADAAPVVALSAMEDNMERTTSVLRPATSVGWFRQRLAKIQEYNNLLRFVNTNVRIRLFYAVGAACAVVAIIVIARKRLVVRPGAVVPAWSAIVGSIAIGIGRLLGRVVALFWPAPRLPQAFPTTEPCEPYVMSDVCMGDDVKLRPLRDGALLFNKREAELCKPKFGNVLYGPGVIGYAPIVARSCYHNEMVALRNRVLMKVLSVDEATNAHFIKFVRMSRFLCLDHPDYNFYDIDVNFDAWINRFPRNKRDRLRRALANVTNGDNRPSDDFLAKAFVKRENTFKSTPYGHQLFDPRLIQGRSDAYQVQVGPWIWSVSKMLAARWGPKSPYVNVHCPITLKRKTFRMVYAAGCSAEMLGDCVTCFLLDLDCDGLVMVMGDDSYVLLRTAGYLMCLWIDCKRWDAHYQKQAIQLELSFYATIQAPRRVQQLLKEQLNTRGVTAHGLAYNVEGVRGSGDPNTSLGNSGRNGQQTVYSILHSDMLLLGKDAVEPCAEILRRLGFDPEMHWSTSVFDGDFCSGLFWPLTEDGRDIYVFGPKVGRIVLKTFWCTSHDQELYTWVKGVAVGLEKDVAHVPVARALIGRVLQLTRDAGWAPSLSLDARIHAERAHVATTLTYEAFQSRYGLSYDQIVNLEEYIYQLPLVCRWWHPFLQQIIDVDIDFDYALPTIVPGAWNCVLSLQEKQILLAPFVEETLKHTRYGWAVTCGIIAVEAGTWYYRAGLPGLAVYAPTAVMHVAAHVLPLGWGVGLHFAWNCVAMHSMRASGLL